MYHFKIFENVTPDEWNKYLIKNDYASFYQTSEYLCNSVHVPIFIYVFDEYEKIVGQLGCQVVNRTPTQYNPIVKKIMNRLAKVVGKVFWIRGPLIHITSKNEVVEILQTILQAVNVVSEKYNVSYIEGYSAPSHLVDNDYLVEFKKNGYTLNEAITFVTDLSQSIEDIWQNVSKNPRGDVNRAKKRNILVKEASTKEDLKEYLMLRQEWSKTKGFTMADPFNDLDYLWKNCESNIEKIFLAYQDDRLISALLVGTFNGIVITHAITNSYSDPTNLGGSLLSWYAIEWSKNNGFRKYDFSGGLREELDGSTVLFYKRKWGGVETTYYTLTKIRKSTSHNMIRIFISLVILSRKIRIKLYRVLHTETSKTS